MFDNLHTYNNIFIKNWDKPLTYFLGVITNIKKAKVLLSALCRTSGPYELNAGTDILWFNLISNNTGLWSE